MHFKHHHKTFQINRYPKTSNRSLRPWSAADEYLIQYLDERGNIPPHPVIYNDRFGFLSCVLHERTPIHVVHYFSQEKACRQNLLHNQINWKEEQYANPLNDLPKATSLGLIKIPKSLDLFQLQLDQLSRSLTDDGEVIAAFMTRHFSPEMLRIARLYFEEVEQSKAWKKARLLILRGKKSVKASTFLHEPKDDRGNSYKQYYGVFSAKHIDHASSFLMEHLQTEESDQSVLDLASGNGVLAQAVRQALPSSDIHLLDDSYLAIESSRMNMSGENNSFHFGDCLDRFPADFFDLVVSNPPFHFEHETNIEVSLSLFKEVSKCLKPGGRFQLVANRHLNYRTHLNKLFPVVELVAENDKFEILLCRK